MTKTALGKSHAEKRPEVESESHDRRASQSAKDSRELAAKGYLNERGRSFNPKSVRAMLERK